MEPVIRWTIEWHVTDTVKCSDATAVWKDPNRPIQIVGHVAWDLEKPGVYLGYVMRAFGCVGIYEGESRAVAQQAVEDAYRADLGTAQQSGRNYRV